ncbi:PREDICTED: uncharacterized protein LOC108566896 [Nicrophorus vespilloides]|uniref:Uncharacterized protein LOC108566896 n=1 Tax=Nicrophorus vespilloides TaxID=110193 RepID=A0ABM1N6P7_NICVS|nr:PREDICTED: uncharacterized protein LOC108566896 [Nicrophorus vespilloides]
MRFLLKLLFLVGLLALATGYPVYDKDEEADQAVRSQRQASGDSSDHHDVVDFGAHTGDHGAFGWHADFPVYTHY